MNDAATSEALAAFIRDPSGQPAPPGIEARRLKIYAALFYNNIEGMLATAFPVVRATLGDADWNALVRDFLREHSARTPLFAELAAELLTYLDTRASQARQDSPWLRDLAHYEWVELALQLSEESEACEPHDPAGDLLDNAPVLSPLAWPLGYDWPVHCIAPGAVPTQPETTFLLVRRAPDGSIAFNALSPLTFRLLERIAAEPERTGRQHLRALAAEACTADAEAFVDAGRAMLDALRRDGTLLGTRPHS